MVREIVTMNLGQAGVQIANSAWEILAQDHGMDSMGVLMEGVDRGDLPLFAQRSDGRYCPRTIFVDAEMGAIEETILTSKIKKMYVSECLVSGDGDSCGIFARGKYTNCRKIIEQFVRAFRRMLEQCDSISGFDSFHATTGGTGSGMLVTLLNILDDILPRTQKTLHSVLPPRNEYPSTSSYNTILGWAESDDFHDVRLCYDNHSMYDVLSNVIPNHETLSFKEINVLPSIVTQALFSDSKPGSNFSMSSLSTNLIPFPHLKMLSTSVAPLLDRLANNTFNTLTLTADVFRTERIECCACDTSMGRYFTTGLIYMGDHKIGTIDNSTRLICSAVPFTDWIPNPIKTALVPSTIIDFGREFLQPSSKALVKISNHSQMVNILEDCLIHAENMLHRFRPYVFWYTQEGMEEGEFTDACERVRDLVNKHRASGQINVSEDTNETE